MNRFPNFCYLFAALLSLVGVSQPSFSQQRIGDLYASDARVKGAVILADSGTSVLSGSQIAAGAQAATLKLERGGSVMVCPGTNLSVTSSQSGRQLLFSMNTGDLELDYPLGSAADSLLTPDFRLLLPGPGKIHVAVRINPNGDTCVQSLPANASALVVSEAMGDESYQVKANEAVLFKGGKISGAVETRQSCGCPQAPPTSVAKAAPPPPPAPTPAPEKQVAPPPPETFISVDAPFVYHGEDMPPDLTYNVAHLRLETRQPLSLDPVVLPPPGSKKQSEPKPQAVAANQPEPKRSLISKIGAFFASIFH